MAITKEEKAIQDARVAAVEKDIADAAALRAANNVVETAAETKVRVDAETSALAVAKNDVTPEQNIHIEARDVRVAAVKGAIAQAKIVRDAQEKVGIMETPGKKIDREAKEAKDLVDASVLNKIEPFILITNRPEIKTLADKISEIIVYLNK